MVAETRTGIAGQFGFALESEVAQNTIVTPDTFLELLSSSGADDTTVLRSKGMTGGVILGINRHREIFHGTTRVLTFDFMTKGFAKLLYLCCGGYSISWPGSTDATAVLTLGGAVPANNETVVIGATTYTWKTALSTGPTVANEVLIGATAAACASNLGAAINRSFLATGEGPGTVYGEPTLINTDVTASVVTTAVTITEKQARGDAVNSGGASEIATTETMADVANVWDNATMTGGVDGTDTERVHTFTMDWQRLRDLAATGQIVVPPSEADRVAFTYSGGKPVQTVLSVATGGLVQIVPSIHFRSRSVATAIASASYAAATMFDFSEVALTIDAVDTPVTGFSLTLPTMLATSRMKLGTGTPRQQIGATDHPEITGELSREFENRDLYDAWIAGNAGKIIATATGDTIPSSSNPYKLVITVEDCKYTGSSVNLGGPDIQEQNVPFEVLNDGSNEPVTIQYHTDDLWAA